MERAVIYLTKSLGNLAKHSEETLAGILLSLLSLSSKMDLFDVDQRILEKIPYFSIRMRTDLTYLKKKINFSVF